MTVAYKLSVTRPLDKAKTACKPAIYRNRVITSTHLKTCRIAWQDMNHEPCRRQTG